MIDWAIDNTNYPSFKVSENLATNEFYKRQAVSQKQLMSQPTTHSTPIVISTIDKNGDNVKVAIRKTV